MTLRNIVGHQLFGWVALSQILGVCFLFETVLTLTTTMASGMSAGASPPPWAISGSTSTGSTASGPGITTRPMLSTGLSEESAATEMSANRKRRVGESAALGAVG